MINNYEDEVVIITDGVCVCRGCNGIMQLIDVPDHRLNAFTPMVNVTVKAYVCQVCDIAWSIP